MNPSPHRQQSVEELFAAALELPTNRRAGFLRESCPDEKLRQEVESLLRFAGPDEQLLKKSPWGQSASIDANAVLGPYRVLERIGAGGMGEVYKALDTRLGRQVALKVLPAYTVGDAERRARFVREARAASRLNDPNTVTIYDIGEQEGRIFIAMEYVDGRALDAVIPASGLPAATVLKYAIPIASALSKAHGAGIVHRDLKPGNIMIAADGMVKVLDFGLAKLIEEPQPDPSPQDAQLRTHTGVFMGTPAFMSPEQAEGKPADPRSDIFSFGAVLYQMATGRRAFTGGSMTAVMAAVLNKEPEPFPETVPLELQKAILRCLRKDPERRYQTMADLRVSLEELREETIQRTGASLSADAGANAARRSLGRAALPVAIALMALLAGIIGSRVFRKTSDVPGLRTVRFTITPKQLLRGGDGQIDSEVSVSPDGKHIAYVEAQGHQLWVRDIDAEEAHPIPGATGVYQAFWSPDGRFVAYSFGHADCSQQPCDLVKVPVEGGTPVVITRLRGGFRRACWSRDGMTILYADAPYGLFTIPAAGGTPTLIFEHPHLEHPSFLDLPGGRRGYLFQTADPKGPAPLPHSIYVLVAGESRPHFIAATTSVNPYPVYSPSGHIVYNDGNDDSTTIWALPFSLATLQPAGKAFPIAQHGSSPTMSRTGTLVYGDVPSSRWQLKWVDRSGAAIRNIGEPQMQEGPALSPDGQMLAVQGAIGAGDFWVYRLDTGIRTRLPLDSRLNQALVWAPSGDSITFAGRRGGTSLDILSRPASGDGPAKELVATAQDERSPDWSHDGKFLIYAASETGGKSRLMYRTRGAGGALSEPRTFVVTESNETLPRFSPDGRFVAYVSDASGQAEVCVREFPSAANERQISLKGGTRPRWSRTGKEIFFVAGRTLFAAGISTSPSFSSRPPVRLFDFHALSTAYDVAADGKRFVILDNPANEPPLAIHVVHNWFEDFRGK